MWKCTRVYFKRGPCQNTKNWWENDSEKPRVRWGKGKEWREGVEGHSVSAQKAHYQRQDVQTWPQTFHTTGTANLRRHPGLSLVCVFVRGADEGVLDESEHTPSQLPPHHPWGLTSVASGNLGHIQELCCATYHHLCIPFDAQSDILEAKAPRAFFLSVCGDIYMMLQARWPDRRMDPGRLCWPHHTENILPTTGSAPSKTHTSGGHRWGSWTITGQTGTNSAMLFINLLKFVEFISMLKCSAYLKQNIHLIWASLEAQMVKNPPAMQETWVQSLGQEYPLKKGMATHSRSHAWRIPWTEEPGGLQSMGSQRAGHDWVTNTHFHILGLLLLNHNMKFFKWLIF